MHSGARSHYPSVDAVGLTFSVLRGQKHSVTVAKHILVILVALSGAWANETQPRTRASVLFSHRQVRPGQTLYMVTEFDIPAGVHIYWRNPGQVGLPTTIMLVAPTNMISVGPTRWPPPQLFEEAGMVTFGYTGRVQILTPLRVTHTATAGSLELVTSASWLECGTECVPGQYTTTNRVVIGSEAEPDTGAELAARLVQELPDPAAPVPLNATCQGPDKHRLVIEWAPDAALESAFFFPDAQPGLELDLTRCRFLRLAPDRARVELSLSGTSAARLDRVTGQLVERLRGPDGVTVRVAEVVLEVRDAPGHASIGILKLLVLAFIGGLILNAMPCVFPVIALKVLALVQQRGEAPGHAARHGLASAMGVLVSFLVLALAVILMQKAGRITSWGMHMQSRQFTLILTVVVTLVALNLFGVFEVWLSGRVMGRAAALASRPGLAGAFFNGMLATVLATPCTAPVLAPAVGFALTQSPPVILVTFLACGLGLATPYLVFGFKPGLLKFLPAPGLWLARLKVALGFPMLGTAVWLFWLTARRYGPDAGLWLGLFLVAVAFGAWVWGEFSQRGQRHRTLAKLFSVAVVLVAYVFVLEHRMHWRSPAKTASVSANSSATQADALWQPWSREAVMTARAAGRPVIVDFTADWCVTCKYNKLVALDTPEVCQRIQQLGVLALVADATDGDPEVLAELRRFGRAGVPLVVVYPKSTNTEPIVLPTLLTKSAVLEALDAAAR